MSKKGGKKGKSVQTRQQQQESAARRRVVGAASASRQAGSSPSIAAPFSGEARDEQSGAKTRVVNGYLDISAVRIQEWLGRTPDLRFRRGASVMLSEATGRSAWPDERLPPGTRWNSEAGDLDGVVSLTANDDVPDDLVAETLAAAAISVSGELRSKLPFCPLQAVAGSGDSYATAFEQMEQARASGMFLADSPAPTAELILAKPCDQCRAAPAEHRGVQNVLPADEKPPDLCGECRMRADAAGGTAGSWERRSPRPERRLRRALTGMGVKVTRFPDDFADLAEMGRRAADDAPTQLALIYADGNRVGEFLDRAAAHARDHGTPAKSQIVPALDDSVVSALAGAVMECSEDPDRPAALAHLAGGDDLLVSVPASAAWQFLLTLLPSFSDRLDAALDWPGPVREMLPSMSAGLVFHHLRAPFADVVRLARDQLRTAKAATGGKGPSVAFLDLTADGDAAPPGRLPLALADLRRESRRLAEIAAVPRAHRETLLALQRLATAAGSRAFTGPGETPAEGLARRVVDLGCQPIWDAVAGQTGSQATQVRADLESSETARQELRRVLDLARWWPPEESAAPDIRSREEIAV
jgi:hypothetical protein